MGILRRIGAWSAAVLVLVLAGAAPAQAADEPEARLGIGGPGAFAGSMYDFQAYWFTDVATWWHTQGVAPFAYYRFPATGEWFPSPCGDGPDDEAAFYCPADDTVVVSQALATRVWEGTLDLTGQYGDAAAGDMGVVYVLAHEYAHNVQFELGFYELQDPADGVKAFELQADCMAGLWGNAVYRAGRYDDRDVEEAISTAQAAGDFDYGGPQHHGTPDERRTAWLAGFENGDPGACRRYVPGT
jgi:predicted metalloprotease